MKIFFPKTKIIHRFRKLSSVVDGLIGKTNSAGASPEAFSVMEKFVSGAQQVDPPLGKASGLERSLS
jgi:hypothetical protein